MQYWAPRTLASWVMAQGPQRQRVRQSVQRLPLTLFFYLISCLKQVAQHPPKRQALHMLLYWSPPLRAVAVAPAWTQEQQGKQQTQRKVLGSLWHSKSPTLKDPDPSMVNTFMPSPTRPLAVSVILGIILRFQKLL